MGYYDGIEYDDNCEKTTTKFSDSDFHFINNILHINKNLKFILHPSQESNKVKIKK